MRTSAVENVGGWDRGAPGRGSEEHYICGKLRDVGYKTAFAPEIRCLHLFGTRGEIETDRWGYDKNLKPEDTGHSDISHPALTNGDDIEEILLYAEDEDAKRYYQE
jgi:GT2 family glycosyltransferase